MRDRPLNLWRWNAGIDRDVVVQQEIPRGAPEWVRRVTVPRRRGGTVCHAVGGEVATLVWLANQNCITPHVWASRADRIDRPDRMIFDLDPPDDRDGHFPVIRAGALALGELLRELGLTPFAMTSGSRGLHVVAPLRRRADADTTRATAGAVAELLVERAPDGLTTAWRKEKRGGRVLIDTARNTYGQTTVAPYAVRALPGAPVATPLAWEELEDPELHPRRWTLATVPDAAGGRRRPVGRSGPGRAAAAAALWRRRPTELSSPSSRTGRPRPTAARSARPAWIDHASRTNCACVQASGVAERVPWPAGGPPAGGRSSHTCSGSIRPSLAVLAIVRRRGVARRPAIRSYSPRSPASSGHARPSVWRCGCGKMSHAAVALLAVAVEGEAPPHAAARRVDRSGRRPRPSATCERVEHGLVVPWLDAEQHEPEERVVDDLALVDRAREVVAQAVGRARRSGFAGPW